MMNWMRRFENNRRLSPFELADVDFGNNQEMNYQSPLPPLSAGERPAINLDDSFKSAPVLPAALSGGQTQQIAFGPDNPIRPQTSPLPFLSGMQRQQQPAQVAQSPAPAQPTRASQLQQELDAMNNPQPVGWKRGLASAGLMALPTALGGIFGGMSGATGAAQGTLGWMGQQQNIRDQKRSQIAQALEEELRRNDRSEIEGARNEISNLRIGATLAGQQAANERAADRLAFNREQQAALEAHRGTQNELAGSKQALAESKASNAQNNWLMEYRLKERAAGRDDTKVAQAGERIRQALQIAIMNEDGRNLRHGESLDAQMERFYQSEQRLWELAASRNISPKHIEDAIRAAKANDSFKYLDAEQRVEEIMRFAERMGVDGEEVYVDQMTIEQPRDNRLLNWIAGPKKETLPVVRTDTSAPAPSVKPKPAKPSSDPLGLF